MTLRIALHAGTSAVLFDLDGTLANTDPLHAEAWYRALFEFTGERLDRAEYARHVVRGGPTPLEYVASLGIDDRVARKPSPDPCRPAVRRLGCTPSECVAIENSPHGIESAKSAGLSCVAILTEEYTAGELSAADAVVPEFDCIVVHPVHGGASITVAPCAR